MDSHLTLHSQSIKVKKLAEMHTHTNQPVSVREVCGCVPPSDREPFSPRCWSSQVTSIARHTHAHRHTFIHMHTRTGLDTEALRKTLTLIKCDFCNIQHVMCCKNTFTFYFSEDNVFWYPKKWICVWKSLCVCCIVKYFIIIEQGWRWYLTSALNHGQLLKDNELCAIYWPTEVTVSKLLKNIT